MDADVLELVAQNPNVRRDRLTALIGAMQPLARVCPADDPAAMLLLRPGQVVLRLRPGAVVGKPVAFAARFDFAIPLHEALHGAPETIATTTEESPGLNQLAEVLLDEAGAGRCGSTETVARLSEALLVMILRRVIDSAQPTHGVLAGLAHPRLHHVIVAIHADPAAAWNIERLAELAGMSRSRFMATFGDVIGLSPLAYVTRWRMELARAALDRGTPPRDVARQMGYGSTPALRRAMRRHGVTPRPPRALTRA
jgi:transcriptional regulator GlxA family with amidase domain